MKCLCCSQLYMQVVAKEQDGSDILEIHECQNCGLKHLYTFFGLARRLAQAPIRVRRLASSAASSVH